MSSELRIISRFQVPELIRCLVSDKLPVYNPDLVAASCTDILDSLPVLAEHVINEVIESSEKALEQTQAVPRLYRRTNREVCNIISHSFSSEPVIYSGSCDLGNYSSKETPSSQRQLTTTPPYEHTLPVSWGYLFRLAGAASALT